MNAAMTSCVTSALVQSKWFWSICIALGATVIALWLRFRERQSARQHQERLTERLLERQRIARELHDTLLQGFQGLVLQFEAVNQLLPQGEAKAQIQHALERMGALLVEGRDRLKEIRSSVETIANLEQSFVLVAEGIAHTSSAKFRIMIEGRAKPVHPVVCEEVYWIGKEALVNAFRHAEATEIEIALVCSKGEFQAHFRDNGRGMTPDALKNSNRLGHWGLQGMYERAAKIGGQMNIRSNPSSGTEVELTVPGKLAYREDRR